MVCKIFCMTVIIRCINNVHIEHGEEPEAELSIHMFLNLGGADIQMQMGREKGRMEKGKGSVMVF